MKRISTFSLVLALIIFSNWCGYANAENRTRGQAFRNLLSNVVTEVTDAVSEITKEPQGQTNIGRDGDGARTRQQDMIGIDSAPISDLSNPGEYRMRRAEREAESRSDLESRMARSQGQQDDRLMRENRDLEERFDADMQERAKLGTPVPWPMGFGVSDEDFVGLSLGKRLEDYLKNTDLKVIGRIQFPRALSSIVSDIKLVSSDGYPGLPEDKMRIYRDGDLWEIKSDLPPPQGVSYELAHSRHTDIFESIDCYFYDGRAFAIVFKGTGINPQPIVDRWLNRHNGRFLGVGRIWAQNKYAGMIPSDGGDLSVYSVSAYNASDIATSSFTICVVNVDVLDNIFDDYIKKVRRIERQERQKLQDALEAL
jgi:hypothetical protein